MDDNVIIAETAEQQAVRLNRLRAAQIAQRFAQIDRERIRPLSAVVLGSPVKADTDKLAALENEAATLRLELSLLTK